MILRMYVVMDKKLCSGKSLSSFWPLFNHQGFYFIFFVISKFEIFFCLFKFQLKYFIFKFENTSPECLNEYKNLIFFIILLII